MKIAQAVLEKNILLELHNFIHVQGPVQKQIIPEDSVCVGVCVGGGGGGWGGGRVCVVGRGGCGRKFCSYENVYLFQSCIVSFSH